MKNFRTGFGKKKLNDKLRFLVTGMILMLMIVTLLISTFTSIRSSFKRSKQEAQSQVDFMESSYKSWLDSVDDFMVTLSMESSTQDFCRYGEGSGSTYETLETDLSDFLDKYKYVSEDVNFISVINGTTGRYVYSGKGGGASSIFFEQNYAEGLKSSTMAKWRGTMTVGCGYDYTNGQSFTITFYSPVYSTTLLNTEYGAVCVNVKDSLITSMANTENIELCLTDENGVIMSSTNNDREWGEGSLLDFDGARQGSEIKGGNYYVYEKVYGWNFYVVSIMPLRQIYFSSIGTAIVMILLTIVVMLLVMFIMRRVIDKSYRPMQRVEDAMDSVLENSLDMRIKTDDMGEDFEKLGTGFNHMMDDIQELMSQLLDEQQEANQIRINALQSQIQPHFLYNTLDTIHWQARMDGDKEMSDMVMALARYYRICLSKGKDIIPLVDELEQISCYLLIQNKRYGDIISYSMEVPEEYMQIRIPKLTLQPLVENSIYHGIRVKEGCSGELHISARRTDRGILIEVSDSGQGMTAAQIDDMNASISDYSKEFGYGVRNVNRRIKLMYGEEYGLFYRMNSMGGITVEITIPEQYAENGDSVFESGRDSYV